MMSLKYTILAFFSIVGALSAQYADYPPECIGGKAEFKRVMRQEMLYPPEDLNSNTGGKVLLSFIVFNDGSIDSLKILESVSPGIDREAIRLIQICQWRPALVEGNIVSTYSVQRVPFRPSSYRKWLSERNYKVIPEMPDRVFDVQESNPDPKFITGGTLANFISRNLEYPEQAQAAGVEGTVLVRFVVEKTGRITSVGIEKGIGGGV